MCTGTWPALPSRMAATLSVARPSAMKVTAAAPPAPTSTSRCGVAVEPSTRVRISRAATRRPSGGPRHAAGGLPHHDVGLGTDDQVATPAPLVLSSASLRGKGTGLGEAHLP